MNTNQATPERFRIGDIELDTGTVSVQRAAAEIELPKLSFDLLLCLTRHAPNVVDTDTLMNEVWGQVVVGEETVKQRIKLLRKALGDSSDSPTYIASVRGRGYRLIAAVEPLTEGTPTRQPARKANRLTLVAAIVIIGLIAIGLMNRPEWSGEQIAAQPADKSAIKRVAVLPFDNFSGNDDDEYLADGITEDITSAVAQVEGLKVIARTTSMRYKNSGLRVSEIARELEVGTVIEGSVQRFGDDLKVTVQLINALNEEHYWAKAYDISLAKLPEMQLGVAGSAAASLEATLSNTVIEALQRGSTDSSAAYDAYLKGRTYYRRWTRQDNETALAFYQQAVELDPNFALAHAGIANAYAMRAARFNVGKEWATKAIEQADLALSINPALPEAYKAKGIVSFDAGHYQESLGYGLKALELNPAFDEALFNIAETYQLQGRWDEAVRYQMRDSERVFGAEQLAVYLRDLQFHDEADQLQARVSAEAPITLATEGSLSLRYLLENDFEQARFHADRLRESFPDNVFSWQRSAEIERVAGNWDAAQDYTEKAVDLSGDFQTFPKLMLAHMLQRDGDMQAARVLIDDFERETVLNINNGHEAWFFPWNMALIQALRGNNPQALDWYEQAVDAGRRRYEWDEVEPALEALRDEPRFQAALERQRQQREDMRARVAVSLKKDF